jgi:hypothetical protein
MTDEGLTAAEQSQLNAYKNENAEKNLEILNDIAEAWAKISHFIDKYAEILKRTWGDAIKFVADLFKKDWFGEWELGQELMQDGIKDIGQAFQNLEPYIEAISPLVQVIIEAIGTVLVWAVKTLWLLAVTAFRMIAGAIEIASQILEDFGAGVKKVTEWVVDLINKVADALIQLGIMEKKVDGLNGEVVDKMFAGKLKGGGTTNTQTNTYILQNPQELRTAQAGSNTFFAYE